MLPATVGQPCADHSPYGTTPITPGQTLAQEWDTYRQEVGRLLAQGLEGKFVLIKDATVVGVFATFDAAREEGVRRFLLQPMLVKQVLTREPVLRTRQLR